MLRTNITVLLLLFSVVVVDLPIDCILSFLFPAETDVLVPVLSQSTDVVVVNFVVVLKFPIVSLRPLFSDEGTFSVRAREKTIETVD